jgi:hypothetical protein
MSSATSPVLTRPPLRERLAEIAEQGYQGTFATDDCPGCLDYGETCPQCVRAKADREAWKRAQLAVQVAETAYEGFAALRRLLADLTGVRPQDLLLAQFFAHQARHAEDAGEAFRLMQLADRALEGETAAVLAAAEGGNGNG